MNESPSPLESLAPTESPLRDMLVVAALLVCTNGPVLYLVVHVFHGTAQWDDRAVRALFVATAFACVLAVLLDSQRLSNRRLFVPPLLASISVVAFSVAVVASSVWSVDHVLTRERSLIYVGLAALAWIIADLDLDRLRRALLIVLFLVLGASLVAVLVSDTIGLDHNGDWRGLFLHSNELAALAALGILVGLSTAVASRGRTRVVPSLLAMVGLVLLLGSNSLTAWVALVVAVMGASIVWGTKAGRARFGSRAIIGAATVASLGLVAILALAIAAWNSSTLAPRRAVWEFVWERIAERPFVGYGWFTVWETADFANTDDIAAMGSAHNSFLEVWLGGGLLALVPFVVIVALALWRAIQALWRAPSLQTWTWCALVLFLIIVNFTLSFVLWFSYNWVLLMSAALRSGQPVKQASA